MEDDLDQDAYGDDFSGYESHNNQEDDEQHTQKVNGKIEGLEVELEELKKELENERIWHLKTKALLKESSLQSADIASELQNMQHKESTNNSNEEQDQNKEDETLRFRNLSIELEKYKIKTLKLEESLDSALALSDNGIPPLLGNELLDLFHFCQKRSFKMGNTLKNIKKEIDEDSCMTVLRLVRKGINMQSKKIVELEGRGGDIPENEQMSRISNLEIELRVALKANDDIRALKTKLMQMVEKIRNEKDIRTRNEEDLFMNKKKMLMLSDHMEKLMNHLKLEATTKLKTVELLRMSERSNRKLQEKIDILTRKSAAKDRLILELREGSKILEDQLRLMDEKYLELRTKLDYARESGVKKVQKAEKVARELRMKFALAGGSSILDKVALPGIFTNGSMDGHMQDNEFMSMEFNNAGAYDQYNSQAQNSNYSQSIANGKNRAKKVSMSMSSGDKYGRDQGFGTGTGGTGTPVTKELSMDDVLDKIRRNRGDRQTWTDDKLRDLTKSR